jgi:hypothetical protein
LPVDGEIKPSLQILTGRVPGHLENAIFSSAIYQVSGDEFLLDIEHTARYLVKGNDTIIVEPYPNVEENVIRLYILSTLFGVVLHKHHMLALHTSCIKIGDNSVLVAGPSGIGKSTLALGLHRKGYEIMNDDISAVVFNAEGEPQVYPGYVHIKLWANSLETYGYETGGFRQLRKDVRKYSFPLGKYDNFEPVSLKGIFFIGQNKEEGIRREVLTGLSTFRYLQTNTFRYRLIKMLNISKNHFALCTRLANKIPLISISRPENTPPDVFADYMEDQFNSL